jgi:hypothetical protein
MNRMIALFQRRADLALKNYTITRSKVYGLPTEGNRTNAQEETVKKLDYEATKLSVELSCWQKAADLLRKEELNK